MDIIEYELTYLLKYLPKGLAKYKKTEVFDIYIPKKSLHPVLRLRKKGDKMVLVKKVPCHGGDSSVQVEHTIELSKEEFEALKAVDGKNLHKIRYEYKHNNKIAEIDIFCDDLKGLTVVDFEFDSEEDKDKFIMPDFCLAEVTQELFIAGGYLAGKSYKDIEENLDRYKYTPIM